MPSFTANLLRNVGWALLFSIRNRSQSSTLSSISKNTDKSAKPVVIPADLAATEEHVELLAGQKWQVFHVNTQDATRDNVIFYWHGGAFINSLDVTHLANIRQLKAQGLSIVVPIYTLAPLAISTQIIAAGIDLFLQTSVDERYNGKTLTIMGDSAGGWLTYRMYFALLELSLGEEFPGSQLIMDKWSFEQVQAAVARISRVIGFSPMLSSDLKADEYKKAETKDPALTIAFVETMANLWAYGPSYFPDWRHTDPRLSLTPETFPPGPKLPLDHPVHSPVNGVDVLQRYERSLGPGARRVKLILDCGTADLLHPGSIEMSERIKGLELKNVDVTMHSAEGMIHVYQAMTFLTESKAVWESMKEVW